MTPPIEQLPHLQLTERQETDLKNYLDDQIFRIESDRQGFIDGLKEELDAYEAPPQPAKSFPWRGASNLVVPVIGSMVDTVFPRLHATIFTPTPTVTVEEWPGELADHAKAWQDFLQWSFHNELDIKRVADSWFMEAIIHGTSIVKLTWERTERVRTKYDDDGEIIEEETEIVRNMPVLEHISIEDVLVPLIADSIENADLVIHRIRALYGELKLQEQNGLYENVEDIRFSTEPESPDYEAHREEMENLEPNYADEYEIYECWLDFDLDGEGLTQPLLVTYHPRTQTLLRVQANPYDHARKPFREIVYFPRHDRFYGVGLARQLLAIQEEISTIHNQRIDSSTIANSRMWKVVSGSRADHSFSGAAPGLKIPVDDLDEIDSLEMGDVGPSVLEGERIALQYAHQRSGVADFAQTLDVGGSSRTTATQFTAQLQQSLTRFNWTLEQIRGAVVDLAKMVTDMYEQFGRDSDEKFTAVLGDRAGLVKELLRDRGFTTSAALSLQVTASSASVNRAVEQQNLLALMQILQQQTAEFEMPLVQLVMNPQTPAELKEYALERIEGSRTLMRRVLEVSDVRNTSEVLGSVQALRDSLAESQAGPTAGPGQPGATPANAGLAGMAGGFGTPAPGSVAPGG